MLEQEKNQTKQNMPPQVAMLQMVTSSWVSRSIYAAAKLGIADLLKDGPKSCDELASVVAVKPRPLYRLLRALASVGVFAEQEQGYFTLTPLAACLVSDIPGSIRALAIMVGEEHDKVWENILYTLQTGDSAFEHMYGMPLFQYYAQNPEPAKIFDQAMTNQSSVEIAETMAAYDFSAIHKLVDIGGGHGSLITSILKANPTMQGILFDLPSVIARAKDVVEAEGILQRCSLVGGDFLESVPSGGDAYMLKHVLHNWDDERAIAILKNCHRAMADPGKLLVVEQVIPPGNEPFWGKFVDLMMMLMFPGACERTETEYRALFEASGFHLTKIFPTRLNIRVMEGVRV